MAMNYLVILLSWYIVLLNGVNGMTRVDIASNALMQLYHSLEDSIVYTINMVM